MKTSSLLLAVALFGAAGAAQAAANCTIKLDSNDRMQFDQKTVTVSAACRTISIELHHSGSLPVTAMGHNVVVTTTADAANVARDGLKAGAAGSYLPAGDKRVLGSTKLIGGGQSTTATFPASALRAGGDYTFFCSFPGHSALMRGKLVVVP